MENKRREISVSERKIIVKLWKDGVSQRKIAKDIGRPHSSVQTVISNFKETGTYVSKPRMGRPSILSNRERRSIIREVKVNPTVTASKLAKGIAENFKKKICPDTVRKILKKSKCYRRVARKKPDISRKNRKKRLSFAKEHLNDPIEKRVIFSNGIKFVIVGIKEINTPDKLEYQYHPASGSVFTFKVRAGHDAHLALTSSPDQSGPTYEIFIGGWNNTKSVIRKDRQKPDVVEVPTPDILNAGEFRGFWIRWYDNLITVGRENEAAAFMSYDAGYLFPVNFVGVCTGWGANGTWLIDDTLSAQPSAPVYGFAPPTGSGPGCWVPAAGGQVPPSAMEGGFDGSEQLYIGRARHEGDLIPGKLHPSHGVCYIAFGGGEHGHNEYEVLCSGGGHWVPVYDGSIPPNAIPGGETAEGEPLFIGRATHDGTITVGKVQPSHGCCYIPYGGEELAYKEYEIYVAN